MIQNMEVYQDSNPYFLTIPINPQGIKDVEFMRGETPNTMEYVLPPDEFNRLWEAGVFVAINKKFNLLIDTYESETIPLNACSECLNIIKQAGLDEHSVFATALKQALKYGTFVECDF